MPVHENEYAGKSVQCPARFDAGNHFARAVARSGGIADPTNARAEPLAEDVTERISLAPRSVASYQDRKGEGKNGRSSQQRKKKSPPSRYVPSTLRERRNLATLANLSLRRG